jgi:hypothetical protein
MERRAPFSLRSRSSRLGFRRDAQRALILWMCCALYSDAPRRSGSTSVGNPSGVDAHERRPTLLSGVGVVLAVRAGARKNVTLNVCLDSCPE